MGSPPSSSGTSQATVMKSTPVSVECRLRGGDGRSETQKLTLCGCSIILHAMWIRRLKMLVVFQEIRDTCKGCVLRFLVRNIASESMFWFFYSLVRTELVRSFSIYFPLGWEKINASGIKWKKKKTWNNILKIIRSKSQIYWLLFLRILGSCCLFFVFFFFFLLLLRVTFAKTNSQKVLRSEIAWKKLMEV